MSINRREFLKKAAIGGGALIACNSLPILTSTSQASLTKEGHEAPLQNIETGGLIRPPGALPEPEFRAKCISCGVCVN
ncbi:MAG: twin-arginine translocation signal domain-containing protein, partial [Nitrospiraceae bacterium]|nr:twin-arginine translocation signal domain-containing protein [Nitrospiraceae bacterium]